MRIVRFSDFGRVDLGHPVVAIGNFDGLHCGHQHVVSGTKRISRELGVPSAVLTFEPHPREFFARGTEALRIYPFREKAEILESLGVDLLLVVRFNAEFSGLSAQNFITDLLVGKLRVRHVVTGDNFVFGKGRGGDTAMLADFSTRLGFGYTALPKVTCAGGIESSSTRIRQLLSEASLTEAAALLGRNYTISGRVQQGDGRGAKLGWRTINLSTRKLFKPKLGVYAVNIWLEGESFPQNSPRQGVANLGSRPTFGGQEILLEAHSFEPCGTVYGCHAHVELLHFIRAERKFETAEALATQIKQDSAEAKAFLQSQVGAA